MIPAIVTLRSASLKSALVMGVLFFRLEDICQVEYIGGDDARDFIRAAAPASPGRRLCARRTDAGPDRRGGPEGVRRAGLRSGHDAADRRRGGHHPAGAAVLFR